MRSLTQPVPNSLSGFSLIEMAVVLMIVGTLLSGVLVAVSQTMESGRRSNALAQLKLVEEALYGFAQANGRLPCPALVGGDGREAPVGGSVCTAWHGFVPTRTLDIFGQVNANGLLLDPWGNPYRYSVANYNSAGNRAFTSATALRNLFDNNPVAIGTLAGNAEVICISDAVNCTGTILADNVPAVVFSMGADWASTTSATELENSDGTDNQFVSTGYAEDLFDDQLVWLSPYVLFNRLISAGKLP